MPIITQPDTFPSPFSFREHPKFTRSFRDTENWWVRQETPVVAEKGHFWKLDQAGRVPAANVMNPPHNVNRVF